MLLFSTGGDHNIFWRKTRLRAAKAGRNPAGSQAPERRTAPPVARWGRS